MTVCVVVPSVRTLTNTFLDTFASVNICIVNGGGATTDASRVRLGLVVWNPRGDRLSQSPEHFSEQHRQPDDDLVGFGSAACRNIGVWRAYHQGYNHIYNLDDDCYIDEMYLEKAENLFAEPNFYSIARANREGWCNPLQDGQVFPRGFPYEQRLFPPPPPSHRKRLTTPLVHLGLWTGTPDINAIDKLVVDQGQVTEILPNAPFIAQGLFPICAMNLLIARDYAPFIYQIPWTHFAQTCHLERYDDILGGLFTCALASICRDAITVGPPFVRHDKAPMSQSDLLQAASQENLGNVIVGQFGQLLLLATTSVRNQTNDLDTAQDRMTTMRLLLDTLDDLAYGHALEPVVEYATFMYRRWLAYF